VVRRRVDELPFDFSLDDSMAMAPQLKLSAFPKVVLVARISASGLASSQPGDVEATLGPMGNSGAGIALEIKAPSK
jgi:cytochrome c-type biogenesis protein CcmH